MAFDPRAFVMGLLAREERPPKRYVGTIGTVALAFVFLFLGVVIVQNVMGVWPEAETGEVVVSLEATIDTTVEGTTAVDLDSLEAVIAAAAADSVQARIEVDPVRLYFLAPIRELRISWDYRLLLLTLFVGALGSWVHGVSSFLRFTAHRQLVSSWSAWYVLKPFPGAAMAVIFYTVLRTGLVTTSGGSLDNLSAYSVASFAALVGLFTEQATKKLRDVFEALAPSREKDADPLAEEAPEGAPEIETVDPPWISVGTAPMDIGLEGSGFTGDAVVRVAGVEVQAKRAGEGKLAFSLDPSFRAAKGSLEITVETASGRSAPKRLTVTP